MPNHNGDVTAVQIGGYPPPYGGVTIHIQELARRLRRRSIPCAVLSNTPNCAKGAAEPGVHRFYGSRPRQMGGMLLALRAMAPKVVHVHIAYGANALPWAGAFPCAVPLKASLVTVHSGLFPEAVAALPQAARWAYRKALNIFQVVIAVNLHIREALLSLGISANKIRVVPAYFPPETGERGHHDPALAALRERCGVLLFTSGFMHPDWGILTAARSLHAIRDVKPGIVVVHSGQTDSDYERQVRAAVPDPQRLLFYRDVSHDEFLAILSSADIYIRASLYDGDSNAVREALAAGKAVIASDCVPRPDGCKLFQTDSQPALDETLRPLLSRPYSRPAAAPEASSEVLLSLYTDLLQ